MAKKERLNIGAEIEYSAENLQDWIGSFNRKLNIQREYYYSQVEYNNVLMLNIPLNKKGISKALRNIIKKIDVVGKYISKIANRDIYINNYVLHKYEGFIFNGLHLHISNNDITKLIKTNKELFLERLSVIRRYCSVMKFKYFNTFRFSFSHHVWGYYRNSNYSFKRKKRYKPIILTKHNTIEFRMFDYSDIKDKKYKNYVVNVIYNSIKYLLTGKKQYLRDIQSNEYISLEYIYNTFNYLCGFNMEYVNDLISSCYDVINYEYYDYEHNSNEQYFYIKKHCYIATKDGIIPYNDIIEGYFNY